MRNFVWLISLIEVEGEGGGGRADSTWRRFLPVNFLKCVLLL